MLPIRTILHPTDFSELSHSAFELASVLARDYHARLLIAYVQPPAEVAMGEFGITPPPTEEETEETQQRLFAVEPSDKTIPVEHFFVVGDPAKEIVKLAKDNYCDLIVLGTHGRTGVARMLMGSTAERVVREAPCPVVTVKNPLHLKNKEKEVQMAQSQQT